LKLSGKRTIVGETSGETSAWGHRRGKSANRIADNLSGKKTGANLFGMDWSLFIWGRERFYRRLNNGAVEEDAS